MRLRIPGILVGVVLLSSLGVTSCGYKVASAQRAAPLGKIAVIPLENATSIFGIEQTLTRAVVRAMVEKGAGDVVSDAGRAEAVMTGLISTVTVSPVTFGTGSFGSTFLVTVVVAVEVKDLASGRALFQNSRFTFREEYTLNTQIENFFSEQNPALDRIANDFAGSVVTAILERF